MKVLIVNTYDNGGAANACIRLHMALIDKSIDSQLLTSRSLKFCKNTTVLKPRTKTLGFFERLNILIIKVLINFRIISEKTNEREQFLDKRKEENLEIFTFPDSDYDITESQLYKEADIINLHWVAGFLDYTSFFEKNKKPIVWTLHDMNPILGGEHYKETYCGIDNSGNIKNRVISETERQYEQSIFAIKKRALNNKANITIVSPSQWLLNEGTQSTIFAGYPSYCIPNGIDISLFKKRDKCFSQDVFSLDPKKKNILFVADALSNQRKGIHLLLKAMENIDKTDIAIYAVGKNFNLVNNGAIINYIGEIKNENLMSLVYSAVDVFIIPSLMDNLPNTVMESLICGTPVIGFNIGGIPDMIIHGKNGMLANEVSAVGLKNTIEHFFKTGVEYSSDEIRMDAVGRYDSRLQATRYIKLFKQIMSMEATV